MLGSLFIPAKIRISLLFSNIKANGMKAIVSKMIYLLRYCAHFSNCLAPKD